MRTYPRNGATIDRIYLHKNEGPEQGGGAQGLANYLDSISGGYQVIVDDKITVRKAGDDQVVDGEGGDNLHCLAICMVGWSSETAAQYGTDTYSQAEIERAAQQVAVWCKQYNVPVAHVRPGATGQAPTDRGIAEHADDHDPHSEGHTDPGAGFPIDLFILRVAQVLHPAAPIDWNGVALLAAWEKRVAADPLEIDTDPAHPARPLDTLILRGLLIKHGYPIELGEVYGPKTAVAVAQFKAGTHQANRIGEQCGGPCAHALITFPIN